MVKEEKFMLGIEFSGSAMPVQVLQYMDDSAHSPRRQFHEPKYHALSEF